MRQPERKPLLGGQGHHCLCPLSGELPLPTEKVEPCSKPQGLCHIKRVRQPCGHGHCLMASLQRLVWIAKMPQGKGCIVEARHPRVSHTSGVARVLLGVIQRNRMLLVLTRRG